LSTGSRQSAPVSQYLGAGEEVANQQGSRMADSPDDFRLLPPEGHSREELSDLLEPRVPYQPPPAPAAARPQFSVGDVLIVMVGVAVGLAGGTWVRAGPFPAAMGLATVTARLGV